MLQQPNSHVGLDDLREVHVLRMLLLFFSDLSQRTIAIRRHKHGAEKEYFPEIIATILTGSYFAFYIQIDK